MSLGPLYVLLGEVSVQAPAQLLIGLLVFLVWSRVCSLYILEVKPVSKISFENIFSHMISSLHFANLFFNHAEALYFDEVSVVYIFLYVPHSRGHIGENIAV